MDHVQIAKIRMRIDEEQDIDALRKLANVYGETLGVLMSIENKLDNYNVMNLQYEGTYFEVAT